MGLITVYAKVQLMSEDDMENYSKNEKMGVETDSLKWKWRHTALHTDDIRRIMQYNSNKCIIEGYDGTVTLVNEPFADVFSKWQNNCAESFSFTPDESEDEYEEEEE